MTNKTDVEKFHDKNLELKLIDSGHNFNYDRLMSNSIINIESEIDEYVTNSYAMNTGKVSAKKLSEEENQLKLQKKYYQEKFKIYSSEYRKNLIKSIVRPAILAGICYTAAQFCEYDSYSPVAAIIEVFSGLGAFASVLSDVMVPFKRKLSHARKNYCSNMINVTEGCLDRLDQYYLVRANQNKVYSE